MFQHVRKCLQRFLQSFVPLQHAYSTQAAQQGTSNQEQHDVRPVSAPKRALPDTDQIPVMRLPVQGPILRPRRVFAHRRHPADRYRELDIMLTEIKQDRLEKTETTLIVRPVQKLARQLQRNMGE